MTNAISAWLAVVAAICVTADLYANSCLTVFGASMMKPGEDDADVAVRLYENKDDSEDARLFLKSYMHLEGPATSVKTKVYAGAALLHLEPLNEDAYLNLSIQHQAMLPSRQPNGSVRQPTAQYMARFQPLIDVAAEALEYARSKGNPKASP